MDLEQLKKLVISVRRNLALHRDQRKDYVYPDSSTVLYAEFEDVIALSQDSLKEHKAFLTRVWSNLSKRSLKTREAISTCSYILELIESERRASEKVKEMRIFDSAGDKLEQAGVSFQREDYPSTINSLNSALELIIKDKLGVPSTISKINTSNLIDLWIKYELESHLYLSEAKKHVLGIDNKVKHEGYKPSKPDCVNAMKIMEELFSKLRGKEIKMTEEMKEAIFNAV